MATPSPALLEELRRSPLFADLATDDVAWIAAQGDVRTIAGGEELFAHRAPAEWMYVGLEGTVETRRTDGVTGAPVYTFGPGDVFGTVPFSRMREMPAAGIAVTPVLRVFRLPRSAFDPMLDRVPALEARFVAFLTDRVRTATRRDQQAEKLTALGRLSAGLAHELNNPAAAARRSATEARRLLAEQDTQVAALVAALTDGGAACGQALGAPSALRGRAAAAAAARGGAPDDALARADREDALGAWLDAAGVDDAWSIAGVLADAGLAADDLEAVIGPLAPALRGPVAAWSASALATEAALQTVERASGRISELVAAVKTHTHMDRGVAAAAIDLGEGLATTLTLLAHKVRDRGVQLVREIAEPLPAVSGFAGELNQVWTNLVDNAIDAAADAAAAAAGAAGRGRVVVRAWAEPADVVVEVEDDGAGVPDEIRERIWEPFFTTKPVGRGTGLGLDIARHIVVEQHAGQLLLASRPGRTVFTVRLPRGA